MQHARAQFQHLILHSRLSQAYSGLKTLYLESNAIAHIEGLEALTNLRCLYLGRNMVHEIAGLDSLTQLESLDLSDNDIRCIDGLTALTRLKFLSLSGQSSFFSVSSAPYCMVVLHQVKCQSLVTGCSDITAHDSTFWSSVKELRTVRQDIQQRSLTMLIMLVHLHDHRASQIYIPVAVAAFTAACKAMRKHNLSITNSTSEAYQSCHWS